jgi:preprotein translocase subunit YajC
MLLLTPPPADGQDATGSLISTFVMFGAVILIFYFMMIRPQQKRAKEHRKLLDAVKKGDRVVTSSGMHGSVHDVDDTTVTVTVAANTHITFDKSAIASVNAGEN